MADLRRAGGFAADSGSAPDEQSEVVGPQAAGGPRPAGQSAADTGSIPAERSPAGGPLAARGFAADDGSVPAELADVLGRRATGTATVRDVVTCLTGGRLLIPLLQVDADQLAGDDADPCAGSDRAMAAVSVLEADGKPLGLAFTGMAPMLLWDAEARPLPVEATRAAGAVLAGGGRAILLDAGSPHSCRIEGVALARLGSAGPWPDPWEDPAVRAAVVSELGPVLASGELQVRLCASALDPRPAGLMLELRFPPGLPADVAESRASEVARRMSRAAPLREVYDGVLAVRVVQ